MAAVAWLDLLLREASAADLERHRRELLAAGEDEDAVEAAARRALQLHALMRERAARAAELATLSDMAARLAAVRDLDELLGEIAAEARRLLRTDVAYLALVEGGSLRIRFFDGAIGPRFRDLQLSMQAGIAGRVVTSGRAVWTSRYLEDRSFTHDAGADSLADEERLRSILGVPLRTRDGIIGVLFAAERTERPFTDGEVSLLSALAGHAAAAMENARLLGAERAAAADLRASAEVVDRAVQLHERLTTAAVKGGGPAEVVSALSQVMHVPVQLLDAERRPVTGPDLSLAADLNELPLAAGRPVRLGRFVLCPVVAAEEPLGCLVVDNESELDDAQVRLLERAALVIALSLVQERAVAEAASRAAGELLSALIEGGDRDLLERRVSAARVDLRQPQRVAVAEPLSASGRTACLNAARRAGGLATERGQRVVLLVPEGTPLGPLAGQATVGLSETVSDVDQVPAAYAEARRCLQAVLALGRQGVVAGRHELGPFRALLSADGAREAGQFVEATVGALLRHDRERGTELARTLETYLASGWQHAVTAEQLHIHPNTLYQRLGRVSALLGPDWREADRALELHLALRLHGLRERLADHRARRED